MNGGRYDEAISHLRLVRDEDPDNDHALYMLASAGALTRPELLEALRDEEPQVRIHAARLAEAVADIDPTIRRTLVEMSGDGDRNVRYQIAFSLGAVALADRIPALRAILDRDGEDPWFRIAVQSSLRESSGAAVSTDDPRIRAPGCAARFA